MTLTLPETYRWLLDQEKLKRWRKFLKAQIKHHEKQDKN